MARKREGAYSLAHQGTFWSASLHAEPALCLIQSFLEFTPISKAPRKHEPTAPAC